MLVWKFIPLLISVADGWKPQGGDIVQEQLMRLNEKRMVTQQPYTDKAYVDDVYGVSNTQAFGRRQAPLLTRNTALAFTSRRTMRPEIKAYVDAFYGLQKKQQTNRPVAPSISGIGDYLDEIFGLSKVPAETLQDAQKSNQGMRQIPRRQRQKARVKPKPLAPVPSNVKAYKEDVYPDIRMRADDIHMRASLSSDDDESSKEQNQGGRGGGSARFNLQKLLNQGRQKGGYVLNGLIKAEKNAATDIPELTDESMFAKVEGAGADRGRNWYDDDTSVADSDSELADAGGEGSIDLSSSKTSKSSGASSKETNEKRRATRAFRQCTPCPLDMIRKYKNMGIKWICGAYQRARRTFKSLCMMRYRNCQDGTMFVKIADHRCDNTSQYHEYHGRSWFYVYKV